MPGKTTRSKKNKQAGFHHVAIAARDFDKSMSLYMGALGFTIKVAWGAKPDRAVMLDTGNGNYLEVFERPNQAPVAGEDALLHLALRTDNCDAALERARAAGCQVTMEPKTVDIPATTSGPLPVRIAFFHGPDGEVLEFFQNELT